MTNYKIYRWDPVLLGNLPQPQPMIYIKPEGNELDDKLGKICDIQISDTQTGYDGQMSGLFASSEVFPNYRPEFFKQFGYYVVVLETNWNEYPKFFGNVKLSEDNKVEHQQPTEQFQYTKEDPHYKKEFLFILGWFTLSILYLYLRKNSLL